MDNKVYVLALFLFFSKKLNCSYKLNYEELLNEFLNVSLEMLGLI